MLFQLVDMKWKLGVAMSSSSCRSLSAPYVTMVLSVADASGLVRDHSFELSVAEFQVPMEDDGIKGWLSGIAGLVSVVCRTSPSR